MKGLSFDPAARRISIVNGDRTVATTDGTLVQLLPEVVAVSGRAVTFPHFSTDYMYAHLWGVKYTTVIVGGEFQDRFTPSETAWVWITATPQERLESIDLMAVPAGADFMSGRLRLSRATAPASSWQGHTLGVLAVEGQWMPFQGAFSALLEADVGMARALYLVMSGGRLLLQAQQSVGPPPGGFGGFGDGINPTRSYAGGSLSYKTTKGIPVLLRAGGKSRTGSVATSVIAPPSQYRVDGSSPCPTSDTSNYQSIYTVDLEVQFGRRS